MRFGVNLEVDQKVVARMIRDIVNDSQPNILRIPGRDLKSCHVGDSYTMLV